VIFTKSRQNVDSPMVVVENKYPITLEERLALGNDEQRFFGNFQDFVQLLEVCEYPIEYQDETIISMSIASDPHEKIVANLLGEFHTIYRGNKDYHRYGSNRHIYLESAGCAYSPDLSIVRGTPDIFEYSKGKTANKNPWLVVEVLSPSSRNRDFGEKLSNFKKCDSLAYIIFVEQDLSLVTVYSRVENSQRWQSLDFDSLDSAITIEGNEILLSYIYDNIPFTEG
jgi:Uma2 family endonuclease